MDSYSYMQDTLAAPEKPSLIERGVGRFAGMIGHQAYYRELATTPAKVDPACLVRPLAPPRKVVACEHEPGQLGNMGPGTPPGTIPRFWVGCVKCGADLSGRVAA